MIAKIAYLTSPTEGRYVFNFQPFGTDDLTSIEIGPDQMRNILVAGVSIMLNSNTKRIPQRTEEAHERA